MQMNQGKMARECLRLRICRVLAISNADREELIVADAALSEMPREAFEAADAILTSGEKQTAVI